MVNDDCGFCEGRTHVLLETFEAPPPEETVYGLEPYRRELQQCAGCGHVRNVHEMDLSGLYEHDYRTATYGNGARKSFERIMGLSPERSDNRGRVERVNRLVRDFGRGVPGRLLDVGSGLAVFPAAMREMGWECVALDPDPRAAEHAESVAGVEGLCADFLDLPPSGPFDLVTFNKVIEHVPDMVGMLQRTHDHIGPDGLVYVELPDGEGALADGPGREEFFVEHYAAFSAASFALLAWRAGFSTLLLERLREPSGKFTLYALLRPAPR